MDFQLVLDALGSVEQAQNALNGADAAKTLNDGKFEAAKAAKETTDTADKAAGDEFNSKLDAFGSAVAEYVASAKVTR